MDSLNRILTQVEALDELSGALHARTILRELWDVLHTAHAATLDDNILAWLMMVTSLGQEVNMLIGEEIDKISEGRLSMDLPQSTSSEATSEERKRNGKYRRSMKKGSDKATDQEDES
jgi:hypothetical protein